MHNEIIRELEKFGVLGKGKLTSFLYMQKGLCHIPF